MQTRGVGRHSYVGEPQRLSKIDLYKFLWTSYKNWGAMAPHTPQFSHLCKLVKVYPNLDSYTNLTLGRHYTCRYNQLVANVRMYVTVGIFL